MVPGAARDMDAEAQDTDLLSSQRGQLLMPTDKLTECLL